MDEKETLQLKFFKKGEMPKLVNKQHEDCWQDIRDGNQFVYR
ncbi:hypothetical protein [Alkalihalobacillus sp. 1P02AB]